MEKRKIDENIYYYARVNIVPNGTKTKAIAPIPKKDGMPYGV